MTFYNCSDHLGSKGFCRGGLWSPRAGAPQPLRGPRGVFRSWSCSGFCIDFVPEVRDGTTLRDASSSGSIEGDAGENMAPAQGQLPCPPQCLACADGARAVSAAPCRPQPCCDHGHSQTGSLLAGCGIGSLLGYEAALPYPCCVLQTACPFFGMGGGGKQVRNAKWEWLCAQGVLNPAGSMAQAPQPMGTQSIILDYPNLKKRREREKRRLSIPVA